MDVRGLLQYVPQFRGEVFVIVIDVLEKALAETMLDLVSLQNIGVRLIIGSTIHGLDDLLDRAAEVELKFCQTVGQASDEIEEALLRGQAVVVDLAGELPLADHQRELAMQLNAAKLILLDASNNTPERGAFRAEDLDAAEERMGKALLTRAAKACRQGIARVHILDGSDPAVLLSELFSNEGVGTMVYADSYRVIRPIREEDIVELLGMIGRSVRNAHLVPRGYTEIMKNLGDYSVMDIDGNVVGCVALLHYPGSKSAEVACLYVKQAHEGMGYGGELVHYAEARARKIGLESVFSLTNRAAHFFQNRMDYQELKMEEIPVVRQEQLLSSGRDSRVFAKTL